MKYFININFKELIDFHVKNKSKATMVVRKSSFQNLWRSKVQNTKIKNLMKNP